MIFMTPSGAVRDIHHRVAPVKILRLSSFSTTVPRSHKPPPFPASPSQDLHDSVLRLSIEALCLENDVCLCAAAFAASSPPLPPATQQQSPSQTCFPSTYTTHFNTIRRRILRCVQWCPPFLIPCSFEKGGSQWNLCVAMSGLRFPRLSYIGVSASFSAIFTSPTPPIHPLLTPKATIPKLRRFAPPPPCSTVPQLAATSSPPHHHLLAFHPFHPTPPNYD